MNFSFLYHPLESEQRSSDNYNSSRGSGGGGNGYEDENPYDGEREDSDQESNGGGGGGGSSRRYYDKEQENNNNNNGSGRSSVSRTTSSGTTTTVPPTLRSGVTTAAPPKVKAAPVQPKKIDLGAAASFGKGSLDINSPTHTTGPNNNNNTVQRDLIDDFSDDLFNSGSNGGHTVTVDNNQEFGDFSSAFGGAGPSSVQKNNDDDDFADFSAFDSGAGTTGASAMGIPATFANIPSASQTTVTPQQPQQQSTDSFLLMGMPSVNTLMAGGAVNNLMPMQPSPTSNNNQQDLLADFGDLNLNHVPTMEGGSASGGEYNGGRDKGGDEVNIGIGLF